MLLSTASSLWDYAGYFWLVGSQMPSCHGKVMHWLLPVPLCRNWQRSSSWVCYLIGFPLSAPGESLVWKVTGAFPTQINHHLWEQP